MAHAHTTRYAPSLALALVACGMLHIAPGRAAAAGEIASATNVPALLAKPETPPPSRTTQAAATVAPAAANPKAGEETKPLGPAIERRALGSVPDSSVQTGESLAWWLRTALALATVLTLIALLKVTYTRLSRRGGTLAASLGAAGRAPSGVLEVLGRYPVSRGHSLVLLRCDRRVLLLGQSAAGFRTLAELSEADDVASILTKTRDEDGASMSRRFAEVIRGLERDPSTLADDRVTGPTPILREEPRLAAAREPGPPPTRTAAPMETPMDAATRLRARLGMGVRA